MVSGDGLVVTAGFVGPGPHQFGRASNSAKNAATHLIIPTGVVEILPTLLEAQDGQILPFDSTSLGGDDALHALDTAVGLRVGSGRRRVFTSRLRAVGPPIGRCLAESSRRTPMREWLRRHRNA